MMFISCFYLLLNLIPISIINAHDIHISNCIIDYAASENALQVSLHIFLDDLELSMQESGFDQGNICTEKEANGAEKNLELYINERFSIKKNNGKALRFNWVGKEISEDLLGVWCYFEYPKVGKLKSLTIKNEILFNLYEDQKNIIKLKGTPKTGYFFLDINTKSKEIQVN